MRPMEIYTNLDENFKFIHLGLARIGYNCSRPWYIIVLFRPLAESLPLCTEAYGISRYFIRWFFSLTIGSGPELQVLASVFY